MRALWVTSWLMLATLACGCHQPADGKKPGAVGQSVPSPELAVITCKPAFLLVPRPEIVVWSEERDRADAFEERLILVDGRKQYRIWWASPPRSHGPVQLRSDQTYTFSVTTVLKQDVPISKVVRIVEGGKVIYEAPPEPAAPGK